MSGVTIGEIADFVGGTFEGPRDTRITGVASLTEAREDQISFLANSLYTRHLDTSRAAAVLVSTTLGQQSPRFIRVKNPYYAIAQVLSRWFAQRPGPVGVSPLASVSPRAKLGANVSVGPFAVIGDDVVIGDNTLIYQGVSIEPECVIGESTIIYPMVSIYYRSRIGNRCIIHSGVVIGADGYGFATENGRHHKIPQIGIVRIEDDVEVGAGSCIDRAALGETVIGEGTKIDNLVQVGHNAKVGKHCLLVAQVAIAGSAELGDYVVMAGQAGVAGHLKIGHGVQLGAKAAVLEDVEDNAKLMGFPAIPLREFFRREVLLRRLPELVKRVQSLEKKSDKS
jgi:UDP-3-O-[3-hydroxymyristoyl] glucosamine N-acyltransferase